MDRLAVNTSLKHAQLDSLIALNQAERELLSGSMLKNLFSYGESKPEWCFLALENGAPVARVAFKGAVREPQLVQLFGLAGEDAKIAELLAFAVAAMREQGATAIHAEVSGEAADATRGWLTQAGFGLLETRTRYRWLDPWPPVRVPATLTFRSMEAVGEEAFLAALTRAATSPVDRADQQAAQIYGDERAAEKTFDFLKQQNYHAYWWQLAYQGDTLIGCACPYLYLPKMGTPGLIRVVPEMRGQGYEAALLAKATAMLQTRGVDELFWETALPDLNVGSYQASEKLMIYQFTFS